MNDSIKIIGQGRPAIAIVGCVHGDEIIGKKVINKLKKIKLKRGSLAFIVAHPKAAARKKRCFKKDLNRCFPGCKAGVTEEKIAYHWHKILKKFDLVIDVHATSSNFDSLAVVTKFDSAIKNILKLIPIRKVALARKKVFGGRELITHVKLGVSLEYGPDKTGRNYPKALNHLKIILKNLGLISGRKKLYQRKELYQISGVYRAPVKFKQNNRLKDFQLIKKGQLIGRVNKKEVHANRSFYPLFLGKGRYKKTLALMANKREIKL